MVSRGNASNVIIQMASTDQSAPAMTLPGREAVPDSADTESVIARSDGVSDPSLRTSSSLIRLVWHTPDACCSLVSSLSSSRPPHPHSPPSTLYTALPSAAHTQMLYPHSISVSVGVPSSSPCIISNVISPRPSLGIDLRLSHTLSRLTLFLSLSAAPVVVVSVLSLPSVILASLSFHPVSFPIALLAELSPTYSGTSRDECGVAVADPDSCASSLRQQVPCRRVSQESKYHNM